MISIITSENLIYPNFMDYSPSIAFPEYKYELVAEMPNEVYASIRQLLYQMDLDAGNYGKSNWNPLGAFISPGDHVHLLPNFVTHKSRKESESDFYSKVTHPSVIRALADYCLIALKGKGEILIGNSPLQSADFQKIKLSLGLDKIEDFYQKHEKNVAVKIVDLRGYITKLSSSGKISLVENKISEVGVNVDLSQDSLMNDVKGNKKFRITNYNHKLIGQLHSIGKHIYCVNEAVLKSDVIISVPKLKNHEKVGVTLGVKGCVGSVASKESLCHHQFGSPCVGGDEYPGCNPFKFIYSLNHDFAYSYNIPFLTTLSQIIDRTLTRFFNRVGNKIIAGAWHGNDTCWRMSVDIANILHRCDKFGKLKDKVVRKNLILIDGIIGGEGQGPLKPKAVNSNSLIFSDNLVEGDYAGAIVMGYNPDKFKIIKEFFYGKNKNTLVNKPPSQAIYNSKRITIDELKNLFKYRYKPPVGWQNFLSQD